MSDETTPATTEVAPNEIKAEFDSSAKARELALEQKRKEKIPALDITYAQLEEMGVDLTPLLDDDSEGFSVKDKIPLLEITWEDAVLNGLDVPDGVKTLQALKRDEKWAGMPMFFIPGQTHSYVFRACTRLEWNQFLKSMKDLPKQRRRLEEQGEDPSQIEIVMKALVEERTIQRFLIYPDMELDQIKLLMPGEVSSIHDSYMVALGFGGVPAPVKI